jgi:hypothetical protein
MGRAGTNPLCESKACLLGQHSLAQGVTCSRRPDRLNELLDG